MSAGIDRLSNLVNSLPGARQRQAETDYTVRLEETIRTQQSTIDRLTEYEEAVHAHFDVACHSYDRSKSVYDNLSMLQAWHCAVALDPKVSEAAAELHDKIDRLTEQRDRLIKRSKLLILCYSTSHSPETRQKHWDDIKALIAEIEAGK